MDLKDFIQTAVTEIVDGVLAAQAAASAHHVAVNPADARPRGQAGEAARASNVSFDVAVTGIEGSVAKGSGKLQVADSSTSGEHCTRLQFSLPIAFPQARLPRSTASTLDSEFMQTVNNGDSTWLPS